MPTRHELLETGLHYDLPFEAYAEIKALNSGIVRWGVKSNPLHMHAAREGKLSRKDTPDMKHGRHIHCRILEGREAMLERFLVATRCVASKGDGNVCGNRAKFTDMDGNWFCGTHKPKTHANEPVDFVSIEEAEQTERIAEVLHAHPVMNLLRRGQGHSEVSCLWERFGLPLKCRLDRYAKEERRRTIVDLKKCRVGRIGTEHCEKAIAEHRYDVQAAMNVDAIRELDGGDIEFWWVFIEDDEPFDVNVIRADDETLAIGWHDAERALSLYSSQVKRNDIRGAIYDPRVIRRGGLPYWFRLPYREAGVTGTADQEPVNFGDEPVSEAVSVRTESGALFDDDDSDIPY